MRFGAPWSSSVKWITTLTVSFLIVLIVYGVSQFEIVGPGSSVTLFLIAVVAPALLLIASAFWMIRGYVVTEEMLLIKRFGWNSKLYLKDLVSVEVNPEAMADSLRTLGVGGLFCYCGRFRNKTLGSYRAYATDLKRSVVLKFEDQTVVVTPDRPDDFADRIKERTSL